MKYLIEPGDGGSEEAEHCLPEGLLLREMRHWVANSLQIVASILSMKARTVKSDNARLHLLDAHARVMAVVVAQRQLLASCQTRMVRIDEYLRSGMPLHDGTADKLRSHTKRLAQSGGSQ